MSSPSRFTKVFRSRYALALPVLALAGAVTFAGCGKSQAPAEQTATPPPLPVEVQVVVMGGTVRTTEYTGRVAPVRVADIRSRVTGIILKRHFVEGAQVKEGDLLFTIDRAPFEAALARAKADADRAEIQAEQARILSARYEKLIGANAISRQDYEDAITASAVAVANAQTAQAALKTAQLELDYCMVRSPINGRIGASQLTEGSLVLAGDTAVMARVQQLDPINVDVFQSAEAHTKLKESIQRGAVSLDGSSVGKVTVMIDGSARKAQGTLLFSDSTVNPATGQIALRAEVANGDLLLLPGMYARVQIVEGLESQAIYIPQRAILRDQEGKAKVLIAGANGTAEERQVETGLLMGSLWQITAGLNPGDRVIVSGVDKIPVGTPLDIKTEQSTAKQ